jgi:formamidopyrimidine-DNA glycosylase
VPELPEVQTVSSDLERSVLGRRVVALAVSGARTVRRHDPAVLARELVGRQVVGVGRLGKYVVLDHGPIKLYVHLRMSGQLLLVDRDDSLVEHTHARIGYDDGRELRFVDPRTFGELFVASDAELADVAPSIGALGHDPYRDPPSPATLRGLLEGRRQNLKTLLMRQDVLCGIGNIYSDEIMFAARLRHDRLAGALTSAEIKRLSNAIGDVIAAAVAARGSSLGDAQYVDLFGAQGTFAVQHQVYGRQGKPCVRCGTAIVRQRVAQRSTFGCPRCQL